MLAESIVEIRAGKLDPRIANALGYLGASYLRALEVSDIERRLDALVGTQQMQQRAFLQSNPPDGADSRTRFRRSRKRLDEFSGGWLTGPLLSMTDVGTVLFVLALIVTFTYSRIAGAIGLASSLHRLPLYLYFIAPVSFNQIFGFGHRFKVQPSGGFYWDRWAIAGVLTLTVTIYKSLRGSAVTNRTQIPERG